MIRRLLLGLALIALAPASPAQTVWGSFSTEKTGTIASTGVYQQVFAASTNGARKACQIQNNGTHNMLVFFGGAQPANNAGVGWSVAPGNQISCGLIGGGVALDAVWIEGTSGDGFEYSSQP